MEDPEKNAVDPTVRPTMESRMFDALERDFQQVLSELEGDITLNRFREEYEKLHRALKKSHESEKRLIKKCRELNGEIQKNVKKVTSTMKMNQDDANTIAALKLELDKAWRMVDASQEKEAKAKDNIQALKLEIAELGGVVDQSAAITAVQDAQVENLEKDKEKIAHLLDGQKAQIETLKKELEEWAEKWKQYEQKEFDMERELSATKDQLASKCSECEREAKRKDRLDRELRALKNESVARDIEIQNHQVQIGAGHAQISQLNEVVKEAKLAAEKAAKELLLTHFRMEKLNADMEEQISNNTQLLAENSQKQVELKMKDDEIEVQKQETMRINKLRESTLHKLKAANFLAEDLEKERDLKIEQCMKLEKELEEQKRLVDQQRRRVEEVVREKDMLNKVKTVAEAETKRQMESVKTGLVLIKNLEVELNLYKEAAVKQDKALLSIEKQSQKYGAEAAAYATKLTQAYDEVRNREIELSEQQRKIEEGEAKMRHHLNLYEAVRTERNLYSKNLVEAQDETDEMKRKFKVMNHLVEQLKEELISKDNALIKEHFDYLKLEKEREQLKMEVSKGVVKIKNTDMAVAQHLTNIVNLNRIIGEADAEKMQLKKDLETTKSERDVLGIQVVRRNQEVKLLYEKMRIQASTLVKGQAQYKDRLNEVRILKVKIADIKREHAILSYNAKDISVLKREIHSLNKELIQEKTKVRALSEELENPLNVHRWRKLEGSDPVAYDMILKIQILQKRLILKTEQVMEKDMMIQEKEKLYVELRNILKGQPGPEVAEQLTTHVRLLNEKTRQLKAMASELNMFQVIFLICTHNLFYIYPLETFPNYCTILQPAIQIFFILVLFHPIQ
ncbi:unnamed protein product [Sphagnum balticum]